MRVCVAILPLPEMASWHLNLTIITTIILLVEFVWENVRKLQEKVSQMCLCRKQVTYQQLCCNVSGTYQILVYVDGINDS